MQRRTFENEPLKVKSKFVNGDEVAILPVANSAPNGVIEIANIRYVSSVIFLLNDGRMFATISGEWRDPKTGLFAVPATDEHRAALKSKSRVAPKSTDQS